MYIYALLYRHECFILKLYDLIQMLNDEHVDQGLYFMGTIVVIIAHDCTCFCHGENGRYQNIMHQYKCDSAHNMESCVNHSVVMM